MQIDSIENGLVIDHIKAGNSMKIYYYLNLDEVEAKIAIIKNVRSNIMKKKDIIKIEGTKDLNLEALGYIDSNITVNIIKNNKLINKKKIKAPEEIKNIIKCNNPRCITSIESNITHIFKLSNKEKLEYRCLYCEGLYKSKDKIY